MEIPEDIQLCAEVICKVTGNRYPVYVDEDHVSVIGKLGGEDWSLVFDVCATHNVSWSVTPSVCMSECIEKGMVHYNA